MSDRVIKLASPRYGPRASKSDVSPITDKVPIPPLLATGPKRLYPVIDLKVGESFSFPTSRRYSVYSVVSKVKKKTKREFTVRQEDDDKTRHRVWRIK